MRRAPVERDGGPPIRSIKWAIGRKKSSHLNVVA